MITRTTLMRFLVALALGFLVLPQAPATAVKPPASAAAQPTVETEPRCEVVINPVHITHDFDGTELITLNGAANCNVPMATFRLVSKLQQYKMGVLTTVSVKVFTWSGSVHKYFSWYPTVCTLAYEAPIFVHTVSASGTTATGVVLTPVSGSADAAQLAGCKGLV